MRTQQNNQCPCRLFERDDSGAPTPKLACALRYQLMIINWSGLRSHSSKIRLLLLSLCLAFPICCQLMREVCVRDPCSEYHKGILGETVVLEKSLQCPVAWCGSPHRSALPSDTRVLLPLPWMPLTGSVQAQYSQKAFPVNHLLMTSHRD